MKPVQGRKRLITTIVLVLIALIVWGIVIWQNVDRPAPATADSSTETTQPEDTPLEETPETDPGETPPATVDPSTLSSIDIEPLEITVFYTKGTGGFEFEVLRASDGTRYVEFSNSELVGTKCSDDNGVFATVIESPAAPEDTSIISETVVVDGTTYGLSLATDTCTANADLLKTYQSGFMNGFSQLEKTESE
jgi:hypothetical protein